jgi:glycosyltransferase involved in cell wall biosynthesis
VRDQSFHDFELIVVDNFSTDGTVEIAQRFADKIEIGGPERSAQRNQGATIATGDFLLFVDSDMILDRAVIAECLEACFEANGLAVVVPEISVGIGFWARCRSLERSCYRDDTVVEAARFFPRDAFDAIGGYDEALVGGEDWDLSNRLVGGQHFPRIRSQIVHDEGTIRLGPWLTKKRYYAASFRRYWRKHASLRTLLQANTVFRPAFVRNWKTLARHPILFLGIVFLKGMELSASVLGIALAPQNHRAESPVFSAKRIRPADGDPSR